MHVADGVRGAIDLMRWHGMNTVPELMYGKRSGLKPSSNLMSGTWLATILNLMLGTWHGCDRKAGAWSLESSYS